MVAEGAVCPGSIVDAISILTRINGSVLMLLPGMDLTMPQSKTWTRCWSAFWLSQISGGTI